MSASVQGEAELMRKLDRFPVEAKKAMDASLRAGGKAAAEVQKGLGPARWARLVKSRLHTDATDSSYVAVGYQNVDKGKKMDKVSDWFKAYWANYGTLRHRDPQHHFDRKIRTNVRTRRNNEGQPAQHFFKPGDARVQRTFLETVEKEFKTRIEKI